MSTRQVRLVGAHKIRVRLGGISRQRVHRITMRADFPAPIAELGQGRVWLADEVDAWIARRRRPALDWRAALWPRR